MARHRVLATPALSAALLLWAPRLPAAGAPDAGAGRSNTAGRAAAGEAAKNLPRSRFFPKLIENPGMLSEKVRARLEETARRRALEAAKDSPVAAPFQAEAEHAADEIAHVARPSTTQLRRMVSFENDEGVTILSNRPKDLEAPAMPLAAARAPADSDSAEATPDPADTEATETRALRRKPSARSRESRSPIDAPASEPAGAAWPWFLLGTGAFAGLGALWFRRSRSTSARSDGQR